MNHLKILEYNNAANSLINAVKFLNVNDAIIVNEMIKNYSDLVNDYNQKNLEVINISPAELGRVRSSYKNFVSSFYISKLKKDVLIDLKEEEKYPDFIGDNLCLKDWRENECEYFLEDPGSKIYQKEYEKRMSLIDKLEADLRSKCFEKELPKDVLNAKILLGRKGYYNHRDLERSLNELLRVEMITHYEQTNKKFINQKLKEYETRKC